MHGSSESSEHGTDDSLASSFVTTGHTVPADQRRALLRQLSDELDPLVDRMVARIRLELPGYQHLPLAEHRRTVRDQAVVLLTGLAEEHRPTAGQLARTRASATRRAFYGLPVSEVMSAFHVVGRQLWDELRLRAPSQELAIALVDPLWLWIHELSGAVVAAYAEQSMVSHGAEVLLRQRFFDSLGPGHTLELATSAARQLSFDPDADFRAYCAPRPAWSDGQVELLQRAARPLAGTVHCGFRGAVMVVLAQRSDHAELAATIQRLGGPDGNVGIGLARPGLAGAELSIGDAEQALRLARITGRRTAAFEQDWLGASLVDSLDRLRPVLAGIRSTAAAHPELAAAVTAFADGGLSLAAAAETLLVHPNTLSYRLRRWHQLAGADPRTYPGLVSSVIGIRLATAGENTTTQGDR